MKLILKVIGPRWVKSVSDREKAARIHELANVVKLAADHIANTGATSGEIKNGDFNGSFFIED